MSSSSKSSDVDEKPLYEETTLDLRGGETITLYRQIVKFMSNFSTRYVPCRDNSDYCRMFGKLPFDVDAFTTFDFWASIDGDFYIPKTYGNWWYDAPLGKKEDFMPQNTTIAADDFVEFTFDREVYPVRLCIFEAFNAGCVVRIWAQDHDTHEWRKLWSGEVQRSAPRARMFFPSIRLCNFKTKIVRFEVSHRHVPYYTQIDGALLMGTTTLILPSDKSCEPCSETLFINFGDQTTDGQSPRNPVLGTSNKMALDDDLLRFERILVNYRVYPESENPLTAPPRGSSPEAPEGESSNDNNSIIRRPNSLAALPDETLLRILIYLDLRTLIRCARLNQRFNDLTRDSTLYTSLNLKPYWCLVNATALDYLTARCKNLRRLDMSWCASYKTPAIESKDIKNFLNTCGAQLTHLRLSCCRYVDDSVVQEIASTCKDLKELDLNHCRKISKDGFMVLHKLQGLERLELYRTKIETAALCCILKSNPKMRHLNLAESCKELQLDIVAAVLADCCPGLESIDCWYSRTLSFDGVRSLSRCINLREVDFGWCPSMYNVHYRDEDAIRKFVTQCSSLEKIGLTAQPFITYQELEPLQTSLQIRQVHLAGVASLTPGFYACLLTAATQLRLLDLSGDRSLTESGLENMRELYPHVSIKCATVRTDFE